MASKLDDNEKWEVEVVPCLAQVAQLLSMDDKFTKGLKEQVASFVMTSSKRVQDNIDSVVRIRTMATNFEIQADRD